MVVTGSGGDGFSSSSSVSRNCSHSGERQAAYVCQYHYLPQQSSRVCAITVLYLWRLRRHIIVVVVVVFVVVVVVIVFIVVVVEILRQDVCVIASVTVCGGNPPGSVQ